ncbi:cation:proton antiporter subunit C [Nocardioides sp. IC4_145]|uniref:sodium:proton antiporter n=1 Tax=Nocardioides sp. IC4_145 TaxID=2714037 RepID=UPI001408A420|nr:cation:proton antiporter subunit C [Nocardioides sp. IC4_145]NHC22806.1 cation:proton antiporter subunit C [Nocardioides sp. IC4_145]
MSVLPLTVAVLVAGGTYLMLQAGLVRIIFGITLLSHGANLMLLAAGVSAWRTEPLGTEGASRSADPLPMAFVLTAIVITLAVTVLMLALARIGGDDDTYQMPDTGEDHHG